MEKLLKLSKNFYVIIGVVFLVWMLFFDQNDFFSQINKKSKVSDYKDQKEYYRLKIEKIQMDIEELRTNKLKLEKFAREKYLMKKPDEDVYVVIKESSEK